MKIKLPGWIMSPGDAIQARLPSREAVIYRILGTRRGRIGLVGVAYLVMISIYLGGNIPYPAIGQEGWVAQYSLSSLERGALAWFMLACPPVYVVEKRAIAYVYKPDKNILRVLDPAGEIEETWNLGDETLADMDVEGGTLASRRTIEGKIWYCIDYDPDENVATPTWEGTVDGGKIWSTKKAVNKAITDIQERALEADRLEREQPEIVRESVRHEMREWIDSMDDADPVVSGDGYARARAEALDLEFEDDGGERDEKIRQQREEKERTNGDIADMETAMPDGGSE